jgi:hypothetical protein
MALDSTALGLHTLRIARKIETRGAELGVGGEDGYHWRNAPTRLIVRTQRSARHSRS